MAAAADTTAGAQSDMPRRKPPRISDLPLSSSKRASIDSLLHTFKKKGQFDDLRKNTFAQFDHGPTKDTLVESIRSFVDAEIDRDPVKYLAKNPRLAAPLLEGAAARADIYPKTEAAIDLFIQDYLHTAEQALRDIRRSEIGEEAAKQEEAAGNKPDSVYAEASQRRHKERLERHAEEMKEQAKKERAQQKKAELEALKQREQELKKEKERLEVLQKKQSERAEFRRKEEERKKARLKALAEEREKKE
ncbi:hypothetical protein KCV05_g14215, partial [Aureobasidium melanogenum]